VLAGDIDRRLRTVSGLLERVSELSASAAATLGERLTARLGRLPPRVDIDPARLAQEIALLADRADISEELTRLRSHLGQCAELLAAGQPAGRRLEFLLQEIGRELNTIGAKTPNAEVAGLVVEAKNELEKLREQVQNVE
jgi:uncharacterized protein (TIGR00255 family)